MPYTPTSKEARKGTDALTLGIVLAGAWLRSLFSLAPSFLTDQKSADVTTTQSTTESSTTGDTKTRGELVAG
jgi:hypothetical protein